MAGMKKRSDGRYQVSVQVGNLDISKPQLETQSIDKLRAAFS